jgi:hypothetical protein
MPEKKRLGMIKHKTTRFHRSIKTKCQESSSFDDDDGFVEKALERAGLLKAEQVTSDYLWLAGQPVSRY